jgi:hypothetical protein
MQITKMVNKKLLAAAVGLALAVGFSATAQAHGYRYYGSGCSTCKVKVVKYRHYYRHYTPTCSTCTYNYNTCDTCNYCSYGCDTCGYGYSYGGYYY